MWECDNCRSTKVEQEWSFYAPMNKGWEDGELLAGASKTRNFWCENCQDYIDVTKRRTDNDEPEKL